MGKHQKNKISMAKKNPNYRYLSAGNTHGEIIHQKILKKVSDYQKSHPHQPIYMMGWGQTTHPIIDYTKKVNKKII